jgi:hypothetical protein
MMNLKPKSKVKEGKDVGERARRPAAFTPLPHPQGLEHPEHPCAVGVVDVEAA